MESRDDFLRKNNLDRMNFIRLFARKVRMSNFSSELYLEHTRFINSQFEMANSFYLKLGQKNGGIRKISKLTGLSENQVKRFLG